MGRASASGLDAFLPQMFQTTVTEGGERGPARRASFNYLTSLADEFGLQLDPETAAGLHGWVR